MAVDPLAYSLRLLNMRLRSRWEIEQALEKKGCSSQQIAATLQTLVENNLVNDRRFVEAWIHTRDRMAPRGEMVLRMELSRKGIPKVLTDQVLQERREEAADESSEQLDDLALAQQIVNGKRRLYANLDEQTRRRRITGVLQRRGFSYSTISRILNV